MKFPHLRAGLILALVLVINLVGRASAGELDITARAAIIIEAGTGRVIWEKNADEKNYPASTTKIMTALLALENLSPRQEIFYTPNAELTEDTPLGILAGERLTASELITGMLLESDNGAAVALAEAVDGSVDSFSRRMNKRAKLLDMQSTHFVNPNGLPDENHYSTVRDMAKLARAAMENKDFREMVVQPKHYLKWSYPEKFTAIENTNKLLGKYEGMTGIKTGWTNAAGGCLAASAKRNGVELIVVLMKTPTADDRFSDARKLLDYGFSHVKMVKGIDKERVEKTVWVKNGTAARVKLHPVRDINYPLINDEEASHYHLTYDVPNVLAAPLKGGETVGSVVINYDNKPVGNVPLVAEPVKEGFSFGSWLVGIFEKILI